jgi:putative heme iron utilization protein
VTTQVHDEARRLLRQGEAGMLATASRRFGGHPFGSVVRYGLDGRGAPLLLISQLAEHTRNIDADPRVSLLVAERGSDIQVDARVTVLGECAVVSDGGAAEGRYLRRFPDAAQLLALGDFAFFRVMPQAVRFIAGFGRIHWLPAEAVLEQSREIPEAESELLNDLVRADLNALWARHAAAADRVEPCGVDADGIELRAGAARLRINFPQPVTGAEAARAAIQALLKGRTA